MTCTVLEIGLELCHAFCNWCSWRCGVHIFCSSRRLFEDFWIDQTDLLPGRLSMPNCSVEFLMQNLAG